MNTVLIVDDMKMLRDQYAYDIKRKSRMNVVTAGGGEEALGIIADEDIDVAIIDIEMPGMDGLELLEEIRKRGFTDIAVIVYTAEGNFERCVRAIKTGAYNFFDKNEVSIEQLVRILENAVEHRQLTLENRRLRREAGIDSELIGVSEKMTSLRDQIAKIARVPSNVLIMGESGTGKELVAKEIHRLSKRSGKQFIGLNCAALPEHLVESELFGFEKGAFTGANRSTKGKFQIADGGTLLLDEIGDMPLTMQAKLLRVLEEGEITRLGGEGRVIRVDVRVIAATHKNLLEAIEDGTFRKDLYYRICTHVISIPPLRERLDDIGPLTRHFIKRICERFGIPEKDIHEDTIRGLHRYDWRMNNVRELENIVERMIIQCNGHTLTPESIPLDIRGEGEPESVGQSTTFHEMKQDAERRIILQALQTHNWHITNTARSLGISNHSNLLKIMKRLSIQRPDIDV
jgi:two-component system, NtrC family, nitrogen regulation response regulator NtrX